MAIWTVEVEADFIDLVEKRWSVDRQLELDAIQRVLVEGGPNGIGGYAMDLEGVPSWENLNSPVSLMLPAPPGSSFQILRLEVQPGFRLVILELA
jgi:hypothetical protein